jgi:putative redox protein
MTEINEHWVSAKIGTDTYKTIVATGTHCFISDEPVRFGGKDLGASPGDLLRISLAACTAITLRMYADRKGMDVREIEVKVWSKKAALRNVFNVRIRIDGNITDFQRKRMVQIGKACPVHKILTKPSDVVVSLV